LGHQLEPAELASIVYETEKIHHGTPSGIDNTVVAFGQPVFYRQGKPIEVFAVQNPINLIVADTGVPSLTKESVADVRRQWRRDRSTYERLFAQIGKLVVRARHAIESGEISMLGSLMDQNQTLLRHLKVSSPQIETLISAGKGAGAPGAKLSGGGRGGNVIFLVLPAKAERIKDALMQAGAKSAFITKVE
jgi:mevalonate kinase